MPHVYLVQPATLVGTNRYKVGMTSMNNLNRVKSYGQGTRYLCIFEREDAAQMEKKLLQIFRDKFKLIAGKEYFVVDIPEAEMVTLFVNIVMSTYTVASYETNECQSKKDEEDIISVTDESTTSDDNESDYELDTIMVPSFAAFKFNGSH